jgi:hypothetical protein
VTGQAGPPSEPTAAERRLDEHLELLRAIPPEPGRALVAQTVRTARWQRAVRAPLQVAGLIAAALVDGLSRLIGQRSSGRGR